MSEPMRPKIGVAAIVIRQNQVLLGKRKNAHGEGCWAFPGGHLEWMESVEDCVRREVEEETGMQVTNIRPGTFTNDHFRQEEKHYVTLFMLCDRQSGEPELREPNKCESWQWFAWHELPSPLFLPIQNLLKTNFRPF